MTGCVCRSFSETKFGKWSSASRYLALVGSEGIGASVPLRCAWGREAKGAWEERELVLNSPEIGIFGKDTYLENHRNNIHCRQKVENLDKQIREKAKENRHSPNSRDEVLKKFMYIIPEFFLDIVFLFL